MMRVKRLYFRPCLLGLSIAAALIGCGRSGDTGRVTPEAVVDTSVRWTGDDSERLATAIVKDFLSRPWRDLFKQDNKRLPCVAVDTIRNLSNEDIPVASFVNDIGRVITQSGRAMFIPRGNRPPDTTALPPSAGNPPGDSLRAPDFTLRGDLNTLIETEKDNKVKYYRLNLELIEVRSGHRYWMGEQRVKRVLRTE